MLLMMDMTATHPFEQIPLTQSHQNRYIVVKHQTLSITVHIGDPSRHIPLN